MLGWTVANSEMLSGGAGLVEDLGAQKDSTCAMRVKAAFGPWRAAACFLTSPTDLVAASSLLSEFLESSLRRRAWSCRRNLVYG